MRTMVMITARRLASIAAVAVVATSVGCGAKVDFPKTSPWSSSRKDPARMSASDLQQFVNTNAAIAGADSIAVQTTLPTGPIAKTPEPLKTDTIVSLNPSIVVPAMVVATNSVESKSRSGTVVIAIPKVRSAPCESEKDAKFNALQMAAQEINRKLQSLDSPIAANVTPNRIWSEYVVKDTARPIPLTAEEKAALGESKAGADRMRYELDVEMTEVQVRQLRTEDRLWSLAPFAGVGLILTALGHLFFRMGGAFEKNRG